MKLRRIKAVFIKQIKDTAKSPMILIMFAFFPVMSVILTEAVAKNVQRLPDTYFAILFATIFMGLIPTVSIANIIAEEKEKNTLRVLMMSNVKPMEYLLGVGFHLFMLCSAAAAFFGVVGAFTGADLEKFILALMAGFTASLTLGAAIGMISKNQMSASGIAVPFGVITAFLPMLAGLSKPFENVSKFLYTQQINYIISDLPGSGFSFEGVIIFTANMLVFITVFIIAFKRKGISSQQ